MAKLLALEWDTQQGRIAIGRTDISGIVVEDVFTIEIDSDGPPAPSQVGMLLSRELADRGIGRCDCLVAVRRNDAQLRRLTVPPAPDDELPDLVRFQALREFSSVGDDWPLDFVRLGTHSDGQIDVLAAAVSPDMVRDIQSSWPSKLASPQRLLLRPFASASLLQQSKDTQVCSLLVELLADEADLTVIVNGQVALLRSVRLPNEGLPAALLNEIRRTLVATQGQLPDGKVELVAICGDGQACQPLLAMLQDQLAIEVQLLDPFAHVRLGSRLQKQLPDNSGRYAAVLGMLEDEAEARRDGIDFLNPRRRPAPPSRNRRYALLGGTAAALLLLLIAMVMWQLHRLDRDIEMLRAQSESWDEQVEIVNATKKETAEVDAFAQGDILWLDELYELSEDFPSPDQAIVDTATFNARRAGGQMVLEGYVREPAIIETMENQLRDEKHQVIGAGGQYDERQEEYMWRFKENIVIAAPEIEETVDDE